LTNSQTDSPGASAGPGATSDIYDCLVDSGSELVRVHADDPASSHVTYSFTDHAHRLYGHLFSIDSESGAVRTRSRLDYEQSRAHYLTVVATDRRSPTSLPVSAKVRYDT